MYVRGAFDLIKCNCNNDDRFNVREYAYKEHGYNLTIVLKLVNFED